MKWMLRLLLLFASVTPLLHAQAGVWTVKPEWVRAHEEFLASDVLAGRGSATRDEQIAATYVASEFMQYGLKTAPGMTGYLQAATLQAGDLDGRAKLAVGGISLAEGKDFRLLASSTLPVSGPLARVGAIELVGLRRQAADHGVLAFGTPKGAVVLVESLAPGMTAIDAVQLLRRSGAGAVVVVADASTVAYAEAQGGRTRTPLLLAGRALRPSPGVLAVDNAIMARLQAAKDGAAAALTVRLAPGAAVRATYNAIGYLPGSDPAAGTILLTAHLDHLGVGRAVKGDAIYNGANDDAAGTTAVLELAHALAAGPQLRRSVLFVCYGSEELGGLGSSYFGEHPPVPLTSLVANLEFEMIGSQDPKMPAGVLLLTGWERSDLGPTLKAHGALLGPDPYPEQHFFERSDNYSLALKGVVAHTAAGWGTVPTYHQPDDDLAHLDLPFMTRAIQSLIEPMRWLAMSDFKPAWKPGGQPSAN